jgi:NAD(P)-dependent dehydrogenase (short-subunit alcohol dehydrogenase family)
MSSSAPSISGRTAVVTGASRGLGLALTKALVAAGWTVIADARSGNDLAAATSDVKGSGSVVAVTGDITDPNHRHRLSEAASVHGGLNLIVNNASYLGPSPQPTLRDYPLEVLRRVFEVNTVAPLALIQELLPLLPTEGGVIINVSSDAGVEGYEGWGGYGSSKAALEQMSRVLAAEHPAIRIYWVDPGDMNTAMHQEAYPGEDISDRPPPEESVPGFLELIKGERPSGRYQARSIGARPSEARYGETP